MWIVVAAPRASLLAEAVASLVDGAEGFGAGPVVVGRAAAGGPDPDAVLVEVASGEEAGRHLASLRERWPAAPLVLLAPRGGAWCSRLAADARAAGWLDGDMDGAGLLSALAQVVRTGKVPHRAGDRPGRRVGERAGRRPVEGAPRRLLSGREQEILDLLGAGCRIDHIAEGLSISRHTVRTHVRNVITKLGVRSQVEAVAAARRTGDLDPGSRPADGGAGRRWGDWSA